MQGKKLKIVPFYMGEKIFNIANEPKYKSGGRYLFE